MSLDDVDRDTLIRLFFEESEEALDAMEAALVALEASPRDRGLLATLFRLAHTLKGNAGSLGFPELADVTHHLEDVLDALRSGALDVDRDIADTLLMSVDLLCGLLEKVKA